MRFRWCRITCSGIIVFLVEPQWQVANPPVSVRVWWAFLQSQKEEVDNKRAPGYANSYWVMHRGLRINTDDLHRAEIWCFLCAGSKILGKRSLSNVIIDPVFFNNPAEWIIRILLKQRRACFPAWTAAHACRSFNNHVHRYSPWLPVHSKAKTIKVPVVPPTCFFEKRVTLATCRFFSTRTGANPHILIMKEFSGEENGLWTDSGWCLCFYKAGCFWKYGQMYMTVSCLKD